MFSFSILSKKKKESSEKGLNPGPCPNSYCNGSINYLSCTNAACDYASNNGYCDNIGSCLK